MTQPAVSIIIPTHNRPGFLPRAVQSAQAAGKNVEVIVVDDASVDETAAICQKLQGIKYVRLDRNQGVAGARNVGIMMSTADKIAFLDDDDLRLPGSLDLQAAALDANPEAGLVCGQMVLADNNYQLSGDVAAPKHAADDAFRELLELSFPVMPLCVLIRKECFLRVGLLNSSVPGIDDWDIFVRIAELYPILVVDEPVGLYRQPEPSSQQGSSAQAAHLARALRHQGKLFKLPRVRLIPEGELRALRSRTRSRVTDTLLMNALRKLPAKEYGFVWTNIRTALTLNPMRVARLAASGRWISQLGGSVRRKKVV
jgi:glycosyltransferase involved in cell wall biosynthesis